VPPQSPLAQSLSEPALRRRPTSAVSVPPQTPQQTVSINDFVALSGLSRMSIWRLTQSGELRSFKSGKKRLIVLSSWNEYVARRLAEETRPEAPEPAPARRGRGRPRAA
jgi:predicted DNA-binding transcriptional regulator AlpA